MAGTHGFIGTTPKLTIETIEEVLSKSQMNKLITWRATGEIDYKKPEKDLCEVIDFN